MSILTIDSKNAYLNYSALTKKKIVTVIGTRPQFIKYSVLSSVIIKNFNEILIDTGQHYSKNLSDFFLDELNIPQPKYRFNSKNSVPLIQISNMISQLYRIMDKEKPVAMLCFGDTNSMFSAVIVAAKLSIPFVHIEAGERNFDSNGRMVHPSTIAEESNRVTADQLASLLLCSSRRAVKNLNSESVKGKIVFTGDIMYDLYLQSIKKAKAESKILEKLDLNLRSYYYCTVHRAINTDDRSRLINLFDMLKSLDKPVVLPMHPRTRKALVDFNLFSKYGKAKNLIILEPIGYLDSLMLNHNAAFVLTDSGGVVREAYFSGVPSVMLDETSEWRDLYISGWSVLAGNNRELIINSVKKNKKPKAHFPFFGNGHAANKTIKEIKNWLN